MSFTLLSRRVLEATRVGKAQFRQWFWRSEAAFASEWESFCARAAAVTGSASFVHAGAVVRHVGSTELSIHDWDRQSRDTIKIHRNQ